MLSSGLLPGYGVNERGLGEDALKIKSSLLIHSDKEAAEEKMTLISSHTETEAIAL